MDLGGGVGSQVEHPRKSYPSDVSDEEWAFGAPYLTLIDADAQQRRHDLREVYDALRWIVRTGSAWQGDCIMAFRSWK